LERKEREFDLRMIEERQADRHTVRRLPWGSVWRQPFVAGFYRAGFAGSVNEERGGRREPTVIPVNRGVNACRQDSL